MLKGPRPLVERARRLRRDMSLPEGLLWQQLRGQPGGYKFRRQHPAGFYVLDFFCAEAKLCVEIDGEAHNRGDRPDFDDKRDEWLKLHGVSTLRIPATAVLKNLDGVVFAIVEACSKRVPPPTGEGDRLETVEGQSHHE